MGRIYGWYETPSMPQWTPNADRLRALSNVTGNGRQVRG
jgi:hypothetical protein